MFVVFLCHKISYISRQMTLTAMHSFKFYRYLCKFKNFEVTVQWFSWSDHSLCRTNIGLQYAPKDDTPSLYLFYAFNNWTFVALRFDFDINQNIDIRRVCLVIPLRNLMQRGYSICALRVCVCMNVFSLEARFCRKKKLARIFLYFVHLISMVKGQTPFSSQLVE